MGKLVTGTLSVDPEAAATKRQIRELETAYRRQNRKLRREAYADGPRGVAAGSERIRLIQDAMSRGIDSTNFGSSEQRGAARDLKTRNLFAEARRMAQDGAASTDLRNQELNARMDDFARSNGNNIAGYSPAARAEYDGLRREALSLAGGFRRASSLGKTGADSASQVQMSRKPGEQEKGGAPDTTTTDQLLKPSNDATGDPSKESGTFAKLTDQQKGIDAGKKNAEQQAAKTQDAFVKPDPARVKADRQQAVQALMDRSKQLELEHASPSMTLNPGQTKFDTAQIERAMRQSAVARGGSAPSKFLDRPQELGGRDGYVKEIMGLDPAQRAAKMRQDGLSDIEQQLVEGRVGLAIEREYKNSRRPKKPEAQPGAFYASERTGFGEPIAPTLTADSDTAITEANRSMVAQLQGVRGVEDSAAYRAANPLPQPPASPVFVGDNIKALQFLPNVANINSLRLAKHLEDLQQWGAKTDAYFQNAYGITPLGGSQSSTAGEPIKTANYGNMYSPQQVPRATPPIAQPPTPAQIGEEILRRLRTRPDPKDPKGKIDRQRRMPTGW